MTRFHVFALVLAAFSACLALAGCDLEKQGGYGEMPVHRRYMIDIVMKTPKGESRGRGTFDVLLQPIPVDTFQTRPVRIRAQAIPLRMDDGNYVFMTIDFPGTGTAPWVSVPDRIRLERGLQVDMVKYPYFAIFENLDRPWTQVVFVYDDWNKKMPDGYSIRSLKIRRTLRIKDSNINNIMKFLPRSEDKLSDPEFCNKKEKLFGCVTKMLYDTR